MTPIEIAVLFIIASIPLAGIAIAFVVALGKRPGLRRRACDNNYTGPERRCPLRNECGAAESKMNCCQPDNCPLNQQQKVKR